MASWKRGCVALCAAVSAAALTLALPSASAFTAESAATVAAIRAAAHRLTGSATDYDALVRRIGGARIVLLGEDTHGTREFYIERARITQRLIAEQAFAGVVIEGDWTEAATLRDAVAGLGDETAVDRAFSGFERFPRWMWRNTDFRDLVRWLRDWNGSLPAGRAPAAVHGMDLYDIQGAARGVLGYLERQNPEAGARAFSRYGCLESTAAGGGGASGETTPRWPAVDCSDAVQAPLTELATGAFRGEGNGGARLEDVGYVAALQGARIVRDAEGYLRAMHDGSESAWNLRDTHMAGTIDLLLAHLDAVTGERSRLVVWAHNAHVGDIRATARGDRGYVSIGQLLRERHGADAVIVGFMTATGTVRAARDWGGPHRPMRLTEPLAGSHADVLQSAGLPRYYLVFDAMRPTLRGALNRSRLQRGIGVRYVKALEVAGGHYYPAQLVDQYDAVVFVERTRALRPLPDR